jgi:tRNA-binding EMAP/Myf-like protein
LKRRNATLSESTHRVEIVPVRLEPHPNADSLSIVKVFDGYTVCVITADWQGLEIGAYIPPDSVVPGTEQFAFLEGKNRIKVKKLRGVVSMGLLVPAPAGSALGDDVAEILGVSHYEPPLSGMSTGGEAKRGPAGYHPVFDVESLRRYASVFTPGELVFISEKIHGANARYCCVGGEIFCGSRTEWKVESEENLWWRAYRATPALGEFLAANPGLTVYGEVFGQVQDLKYGTAKGEGRFAAFDILRPVAFRSCPACGGGGEILMAACPKCGGEGRISGNFAEWVDPVEARETADELPWVPTIARNVPFDLERILELAEGPSLVPGAEHVREGCVVKPMVERTERRVGRVCLKVVGYGYMERV